MKTATIVLSVHLVVTLGGCGAGSGDPTASGAGDGAAPAPAVLASDAGTALGAVADATSGELLRGFESQLRFADNVALSLKRDALALDDERLDRQLSAIDERLGVLRARLDGLRRLDRAAIEAARPQWESSMDDLRSMCSRARELAGGMGG